VYVFVIILIPLIISCGKDSEKIEDYYTVVDSIRLERPVYFYTHFEYIRVNDYFIVDDQYDQQLLMFSSSGALLDTCGRLGKGPNEFLEIVDIDSYDNTIYLIDRGNGKVAIFEIDDKNQKLLYKDEFLLDRSPVEICALDRDKILITSQGRFPNVQLYDSEGKVLAEYSIPQKASIKTQEDALSMVYLATKSSNASDTYILFSGTYDMELYFCKFDNNDNSIQILKEVKTRFRRKSKASKRVEIGGRKSTNIYGICASHAIGNKFYVVFHPYILNAQGIKSSLFEIYDIEGNYLGNAYLKDHYLFSACFSSQADTLWFFREAGKEDLIYVCEKEESK
jgi:hypothetical protein